MVLVALTCALVGNAGVFGVKIDDSAQVWELKKAIKAENSDDPILKNVAFKSLRLFLAKTGDTWLLSRSEDIKKLKKGEQTDLIKALTHEDNELDGAFGLEEVLEEMPELKTKQIHVLVVVPTPPQSRISPNTEPKGPEIKLTSTDILAFLETQMKDPAQFHVIPHLLPESERAFQLSGREMALQEAAMCMKMISAPPSTTSKSSRNIPVCAGLSGLGKSRMLEEWERIFDLAEIKGPRLGALVLYYNGQIPSPVECSMTIEASFSWRLLHRLFLERNGDKFATWFSESLPKNGGQLRLRTALEVVRDKARQLKITSSSDDTLQLFLGVDEYQAIKEMDGQEELLQDLLNTLGDIMASPVKGVRIYPMFAGTNFAAISDVNSFNTQVLRLPMLLLSPSEVETAVFSVPHGASLLMQPLVRRHLFYLGGVPRWCFVYISLLQQEIDEAQDDMVLTVEQIEKAFYTVKDAYIERWGKNLAPIDLINLCAYSVAGVAVDALVKVIGGMSWAHVRDSSLCLLSNRSEVLIPYAIFHRVARLRPDKYSPAQRCFIECVQGLITKVDALIYDKAPWALWEVFGAYFHAFRINAMIIVGKPVIQVSELFRGALVNGCDDQVKLVPTKVMQYDGQFGSSIKSSIGCKQSLETHNWLTEGYVVINGDNGKGVDIFFALKKIENNGYVVCLDQRKRVAGINHGSVGISNLLSAAKIVPTALGNVYDPITVVPLVFSSLCPTTVQELKEQNAVVVTYAQMKAYHHELWLHPASSPCVNVNKDSVSNILMVLTGSGKDTKTVAKQISGRKRKFTSIEEFRASVKKIRNDVEVSNEERIVFC